MLEMNTSQIINSIMYSLRELEEEIEDGNIDGQASETISHIRKLVSDLKI